MIDTKVKHTPGPWEALVVVDSHMGIAYGIPQTDSVSEAEHEANARLIAAAPELLEALEPFTKMFGVSRGGETHVACSIRWEDLERAEKAIRKAKGEL